MSPIRQSQIDRPFTKHLVLQKCQCQDFLGGPVAKDPVLPMQGSWSSDVGSREARWETMEIVQALMDA